MSELILNPDSQLVTVESTSPTVSVLWDQAVQQAVINTAPGPTIGSRAYAMVHTAIFDAWAAYDQEAIATQLGDDLQRPEAEVTEANKQEAVSFAAYRVLKALFPSQADIFDSLMAELGFNPQNNSIDTATPAGIGNISAQALLNYRDQDGANQLGDSPNGNGNGYADATKYLPVNSPDKIIKLDAWTPELVPLEAPDGKLQQFLTPQWGQVTPFARNTDKQFFPTEPEPFLLVDGTVDLANKSITLQDDSVLKIEPDLVGSIINPKFIEQATEVVEYSANLTDRQKLIAEFWEDGAGTSFPPGTWMTFGQFVSARDNNSLDDDVKLFFGLGNAVFDAGIATWNSKVFYDYARPVRTVRELGKLGLIGEFNSDLGGYAINAWQPGVGTQTILARDFVTYQTPGGDPSPPFAEYTSGHSAFSAAAAEVLSQFTGSDAFGAAVTFAPGESRFEPGRTPKLETTLAWDTFSEAADEGGISRLYGGIHFEDGDFNGRKLGREIGSGVFDQAQFYINGGEEKPLSLDFDESSLPAGTIVSEQFEGLTIRSDGLPAMIFDTANPTGGDTDLASDRLGNVLILSEDGDSSDPDDNATGGTFYFDWDNPVNIESVGLLDVENAGGNITLYGVDESWLGNFDISNLTSDGGTALVDINCSEVSKIELALTGSGAVTCVNYF